MNKTCRSIPLILVAYLSACSKAPESPDGGSPATQQRLHQAVEFNYTEDPLFTDGQKELLANLEESSAKTLVVRPWARAGTVGMLTLDAPSGAPADSKTADHAMSFISEYAALWNLAGADFRVVNEDDDSICPSATVQVFRDETPVFNNKIRVYVSKDGRVTGIIGGMDGTIRSELLDNEAPPEVDARTLVLSSFAADPELEREFAAEVAIYDPFFVTESAAAPRHARVYTAQAGRPEEPDETDVFAVVSRDGKMELALAGRHFDYQWSSDDPCLKDPRFGVPLVIGSDAGGVVAVDFEHLGGLSVAGGSLEERAWAALQNKHVGMAYGFSAPQNIFYTTAAKDLGGGIAWAGFQQRSQGIKVEGAEIVIRFTGAGIVSTVAGSIVREPRHATKESSSSHDAIVAASTEVKANLCGSDSTCSNAYDQQLAMSPATAELIVLSQLIYPDIVMGERDRLAWRIDLPGWLGYYDAESGEKLLLVPVGAEAAGLPYNVRNYPAGDVIEIENGTPVAGVTPTPNVQTIADGLAEVDNYFRSINRASIDNNGLVINASADFTLTTSSADGGTTTQPFGNAKWCFREGERLTTNTACPREGAIIGSKFTSRDIVAHEIGHGLVAKTADFELHLEPGALHEHFGDVLQARVSTDGTEWTIGDAAEIGVFRHMDDPTLAPYTPDHYGLKTICTPNANIACVHEWAGIPNKAFVLASEGDSELAITKIGRGKAGDIWVHSLTSPNPWLTKSAGFVHLRATTQLACRDMARNRKSTADGAMVTFNDCDSIWKALNAVGVPGGDATYQHFNPSIHSNHWSYCQGKQLFNGCDIRDHLLILEDEYGSVASSSVSEGGSVTLGTYRAHISSASAPGDSPPSTNVCWSVQADWFGLRVQSSVWPILSYPPGFTGPEEACYHQQSSSSTVRYKTELSVNEWACCGLDANSGTTSVDLGDMPLGCRVISVTAEESHKDGTLVYSNSDDHGGHLWRLGRGSTPDNRIAHNFVWWHSGFSGIFLRAIYEIEQPSGVNCWIPGLSSVP